VEKKFIWSSCTRALGNHLKLHLVTALYVYLTHMVNCLIGFFFNVLMLILTHGVCGRSPYQFWFRRGVSTESVIALVARLMVHVTANPNQGHLSAGYPENWERFQLAAVASHWWLRKKKTSVSEVWLTLSWIVFKHR